MYNLCVQVQVYGEQTMKEAMNTAFHAGEVVDLIVVGYSCMRNYNPPAFQFKSIGFITT